MDIIFEGRYTIEEIATHFIEVLQLLNDQYQIEQFREIHVALTLMDRQGIDLELVDSNTAEVYRVLKVCHKGRQLHARSKSQPLLQLVVNNSNK